MERKVKNAAVFLGSSDGDSPVFRNTAIQLGRRLAEEGIGVVYGGADVGTMAALADGAVQAGGRIIGVFPEGFGGKPEVKAQNREIVRKGLSEIIFVKNFAERKQKMSDLSDCCIVLPGSIGTMDELFCYAIDNEIGLHSKISYILNVDGYYDPLEAMFAQMKARAFLPLNADMIQFVCSIDELIERF